MGRGAWGVLYVISVGARKYADPSSHNVPSVYVHRAHPRAARRARAKPPDRPKLMALMYVHA